MFVWVFIEMHSMAPHLPLSMWLVFMVWLLMMGGSSQNGMLYMLFCVERPPVSVFVVMV